MLLRDIDLIGIDKVDLETKLFGMILIIMSVLFSHNKTLQKHTCYEI